MLQAIKEQLSAEGIDLPFPTRQILFHDQTEESDGDRSRQREGWPGGKSEVPKSGNIASAIGDLAGRMVVGGPAHGNGGPPPDRNQLS